MAFNNLGPLYPKPAYNAAGTIIASQSTTVSTVAIAATGFDAQTAAALGPDVVTFDVQVSDVYCRWDGTDPTSSVGHILPAGSAYTWSTAQYNAAKFIRSSTATEDAILFASPMQG